MAPHSNKLLLLLLPFLCIQLTHLRCSVGDDSTSAIRCLEMDRKALVEFKKGLRDPTNRLSSWVGDDCCTWDGVRCDNRSGHIIRLDLRNPEQPYPDIDAKIYAYYNTTGCFSGEINPSLVGLPHLNYLDLSGNCFTKFQIPKFIGSLRELRYLNLSVAGFSGAIPHELGNLSNLRRLDLSWMGSWMRSDYYFEESLYVESFQWLPGLTSLQYLAMSYVNLSKTSAHWVQALNALPSLRVINLRQCDLGTIPLSLPQLNLTSLTLLDLSDNIFFVTIPLWLFNMSRLEHLDLHGCYFYGLIPESLGNLKKLKYLDLSYNEFFGSIPVSLGNLKKLKYLNLHFNDLSGSLPMSLGKLSSLQMLDLSVNELNVTIPNSLWQLSELVYLDLSYSYLTGTVFEENLSALTKLEGLYLGDTSLVMKVSTNWIPPFQLKGLYSCNLGPQFPAWLQTQVNLIYIDLSYAGISGTVPPWFWNLTSKISYLDLSFNKLCGRLFQSLMFAGDNVIVDLSSNLFDGPVPQFLSEGMELDLSNNSLTGPLPLSTWPILSSVSLSMNKINGSIPSSFCEMKHLLSLDLSKNQLSGHIPDCWSRFSDIWAIDFSNNNLTGGIPKSFCSLPWLRILHLRNNSLTGELPTSLQSCVQMQVLDLGQNKLEGNIPGWIGETLSELIILRLDSNMFDGHIPPQLSHLQHIHILDLSTNKLPGTIPTTFGDFSAMQYISPNEIINDTGRYEEHVLVLMKARELEYKDYQTISHLRIIDLSNNHLSGNIPKEIAKLLGLQSLNLSRNLLNGQIIDEIGELQQLVSLDLSRNMLSGAIPPSLSTLTFLESLNLSYNNLSGRIPKGNQLQTLTDPSIYAGNINLCGFPLAKICQDDESPATPRISSDGNVENEDDDEAWFYSGIGPGFAVGLCAVLGLLLAKKRWRRAYFQFTDTIYDRIYVVIMVKVAILKRKVWANERGHSSTP